MKTFCKDLPKSTACRVITEKVVSQVNPDSLSKVFSQLEGTVILGGNENGLWSGGYSYWMAQPRFIFEFYPGEQNPFEKLDNLLRKFSLQGKPTSLPDGIFCGGWAGFFGYELGRHIENLPEQAEYDLPVPIVRLGFYDKLICYDHTRGEFLLISLQFEDEQGADKKIESLKEILKQAESEKVGFLNDRQSDNFDFSFADSNISEDYYLESVEKIKRYIYDGEVYQVNFSRRFETDFTAKPVDLFLWENRYNPSGYSGYIDGGDFQIVSASPEMFITAFDGEISTKPIKGTRRRFSGKDRAGKNAKNYNELLKSGKEKAELNMIIDLERNDLGRICEYGTIKVTQPRTIETYPTVFHAVATVSGKLRKRSGLTEILKGMFPGGSITGAPKVRSMEVIDELEPTARGVYTSNIGFVGVDGSVCLNIAIRTVIINQGKSYVQVGGGIVADSDPQAELDETLAKGKALMEGIRNLSV